MRSLSRTRRRERLPLSWALRSCLSFGIQSLCPTAAKGSSSTPEPFIPGSAVMCAQPRQRPEPPERPAMSCPYQWCQAGAECLARLSRELFKLPNLHLASCHHPSRTITIWTGLGAPFSARDKVTGSFPSALPRQQQGRRAEFFGLQAVPGG